MSDERQCAAWYPNALTADASASVWKPRRAAYYVHIPFCYGVHGQTMEELREDLRRAGDTGSTHISCFRLQVVPYTALKLRETSGQLAAQPPMGISTRRRSPRGRIRLPSPRRPTRTSKGRYYVNNVSKEF